VHPSLIPPCPPCPQVMVEHAARGLEARLSQELSVRDDQSRTTRENRPMDTSVASAPPAPAKVGRIYNHWRAV
jgi:hypothetical protein